MYKVTISIVNTNKKNLILNNLNSIKKYPPSFPYEILVLDNASTDSSFYAIKNNYPKVDLIRSSKKLTCTQSRNINLKRAKGEYVFILDDDCEVVAGSFDVGINFLENNKNYAGVACQVCNKNGEILVTSGRQFPSLLNEFLGNTGLMDKFPQNKFFGRYNMTYWDHKTEKDVDMGCEGAMLFRHAILKRINYFDENIIFFSEGPDLFKKISEIGYKIKYIPQCTFIHNGNSEYSAIPYFHVLRHKSRYYYFKKHHGKIYAIFFKVNIFLITILSYIRNYVYYCFKRNKNDYKKHYYRLIFQWIFKIS